ncbi:MAG: UDP-N-acetylmuramoyl-tripeptide--D-alanyl-D-alanine ligase [Cyanobacteria bacterium]|nr:UDP-N-acetylmuramoyl-tripeptide--D-alanyl-D-alanine ligase [Cyanobacteriota bacterium]MDA1020101.1 UDP-N-acetylmuramoyl-tripeptide--D-alanyl-D-alanine ligase [Cyanobacteriota bacterium]
MGHLLNKTQYIKISTDTRTLKQGDIYLALKGDSFDGHQFIDQALSLGADIIISEQKHADSKIKVVTNTLETYHQLANEYRNLINPITIAITGSSGKTTLKELLIKLLEQKYKVHATEANFNNEIGVPKTILSMPEDTEVLILEMGMRGLGEIQLLSETSEPNIAIITNTGTAHIERLGSVEKIREAKLEIVKGIREKGIGQRGRLVVDPKLYQSIKDQYQDLDISEFSLSAIPYSLSQYLLLSDGLLASINAAIVVGKLLKLTEEQIQDGINNYRPTPGRGQFIEHHGNLYIDETYNSNPEAVRNSVYALIKQFPDDYKIALLGDIKESQAKLIEELFIELQQLENDKFKLLDARNMNAEQATKLLDTKLKANHKNIILVKASRAAKFENCINNRITSFGEK